MSEPPVKITVPMRELRDHLIQLRDKHIGIHGRGREADRAHLHEALHTIENLPLHIRAAMQRAFNRHLMRERREAWEAANAKADQGKD